MFYHYLQCLPSTPPFSGSLHEILLKRSADSHFPVNHLVDLYTIFYPPLHNLWIFLRDSTLRSTKNWDCSRVSTPPLSGPLDQILPSTTPSSGSLHEILLT